MSDFQTFERGGHLVICDRQGVPYVRLSQDRAGDERYSAYDVVDGGPAPSFFTGAARTEALERGYALAARIRERESAEGYAYRALGKLAPLPPSDLPT